MWSIGLGFIIGTVLGSLVECLAERSLTKESFWGRSYCPKCKHALRWYDLFPVLSYLILRGNCRDCTSHIPGVTLLIEVVMGLLIATLFYLKLPANLLNLPTNQLILSLSDTLFFGFVICVLMIFVITDLKKGLIPDRISIPAILIGFVYLLIITVYKGQLFFISLYSNPVGRYLLPPHSDYFIRHFLIDAEPLTHGLLAMLMLSIFFGGLIFLTRGRGMGGGDLKLAAFIGLSLGLFNSILAVFLAFLSGAIIGVGLLIFRKRHFGQTIPFGPFLALGAILAIFWGEQLVNFYLKLKIV